MGDLTASDIGNASVVGTTLAAADFRAATKLWPDIELPGDATNAITDANIVAGIAAAFNLVERYCNDDFRGDTSSTSTVTVDGSGTRELLLPKRVQTSSVTGVVEVGSDNSTTTVDSTTYRVRASLDSAGAVLLADYDSIVFISKTGKFTAGPRNYQITAKFGWQVVPTDVLRAVALIVYDWYSGKNSGLHRSTRWQAGQTSYERARDVVLGIPEVSDLLDPFILHLSIGSF